MVRDVGSILSDAIDGKGIGRQDSIRLLDMPEDSGYADAIISSADGFVRDRCRNQASIGAQIGIITGPCYADCGFCAFAYSTTDIEDYVMKDDELSGYLRDIVSKGCVSSVSLMTIHNFDFDDLLHAVELSRSTLPDDVELCINTGDLESGECRELKDAGVDSAYHALRLGESTDNLLEPLGRYETIRNLISAGIRVATGVEPIGPEHSSAEIMDSYLKAYDMGCSCCSASARESVPGTRLYGAGEISARRLKMIRSVLLLSSTDKDRTEFGFYGGFYGGFNRMFAEYAGSPKDLREISEKGLGRTVEWVRERLISDNYAVPVPLHR